MARLLITSEGFADRVLELHLGVNRFGRSKENHFQLNHPTVSDQHCEITVNVCELLLRDCDSTNGTFVNGKRVQSAALSVGQSVRLGDVELRVDDAEVRVAIPVFDMPRPAPPVVLDDGSMLCPKHPGALVTHQCTNCRQVMCQACVHGLRRRGGKLLNLCPLCSHPVRRLQHGPQKKRSLIEFLKSVKLPFGRQSKPDE